MTSEYSRLDDLISNIQAVWRTNGVNFLSVSWDSLYLDLQKNVIFLLTSIIQA